MTFWDGWTLEQVNPRFKWEDETTLTMKVTTPDGVLTNTVSWTTPELAQENGQGAIDDFMERVRSKIASGEPLRPMLMKGQRNRHYRRQTRIGTFYLHILIGPPTWWKPKFEMNRGLMLGWLRLAIGLAYRREPLDTPSKEFG